MTPLIEATQKKVRETEFFLRLLVHEREKFIKNEPEAFVFYLSAFLSAARSVTFALQSEWKEKYDAWFPTWIERRTEDERQLFDFLKTQRNIEQHQGGALIDVALEYFPIIEVRSGTLGDPIYSFQWFGPPGTPLPEAMRSVHKFDFGGTQIEVTALCQRYFDLLKQLVEAFAETHR